MPPSPSGEPSGGENAARLWPRWAEVCGKLGVDTERRQEWWQDLERRHREPQRSYHTFAHLVELFDHMDANQALVQDMPAVTLAIFFHDAVYDPKAGSPKNEQDSAVLFDKFGQEALPAGDPLGLVKGELIAKVRRWIVQTATHKTAESDDEDCRLFMDFDMGILGSEPERYQRYCQMIRQEYQHVAEPFFCKARGAFLEDFLKSAREGKRSVYATEVFRSRREHRALENMEREAEVLARRLRSCSLPTRALTEVVVAPGARRGALRLGCLGAAAAAAAGSVLRPLLAAKVAGAAIAVAGVGAAAFGLYLAFGAKYVRHPFPEPTGSDGEVVVLAGSYNPPHLGHLEMLRYLSKKHARVVAIIGVNPNKKYDVSPYQRQEILRAMLAEIGLTNVEVVVWGSIIFFHAHAIGAKIMYRGIRTWKEDSPAEKYLEFQNLAYQLYHRYWPIPTAYLQGAPSLSGVSSTLLRSRLAAGDDISDLVPQGCAEAVRQAYSRIR